MLKHFKALSANFVQDLLQSYFCDQLLHIQQTEGTLNIVAPPSSFLFSFGLPYKRKYLSLKDHCTYQDAFDVKSLIY